MWPNRDYHLAGLAHFELLLVVILVFLLIATLLQQVLVFNRASEQVQVETVLTSLRAATHSLIAEHVVAGELDKLADYRDSNPINLLAAKPINYQAGQSLESAYWYFNEESGLLIYQLRAPEKVDIEGAEKGALRFAFRLHYQDYNHNQRFDRGLDSVTGLTLEPISGYRWLN